MTRKEAAEQLRELAKMTIPPVDDPFKITDAFYTAIEELEKDAPTFPDLHLIDKDKFLQKLKDARCMVNTICTIDHHNDGFVHPMVTIIDTMIKLIESEDEVKLG